MRAPAPATVALSFRQPSGKPSNGESDGRIEEFTPRQSGPVGGYRHEDQMASERSDGIKDCEVENTMEALIGLVGVAVGWLLAYMTDRQKLRAEAKNAAKVIYAEMIGNRSALQSLIDSKGKTAEVTMRRLAWDTYGVTLLRIADDATLVPIVTSYHLVDLAPSTVKYFRDQHGSAMADLKAANDELQDGPTSRERGLQLTASIKRKTDALKTIDESLEGYLTHLSKQDVPDMTAASKRVLALIGR